MTQGREDSRDPLLQCLFAVAKAHGRAVHRDTVLSGLPLREGRLSPALFARAARRAGLASKAVRRPLQRLNEALYPVVLILNDEDACLLLGWSEDGSEAHILSPQDDDAEVWINREELEARYAGVALFARPDFRFDARTPEVGDVRERHWFWGALLDNLPLYRDVLLAAFLINSFAIAVPLFAMNVYDRVVPNQALDTLYVLAIGVAIVLIGDIVLRTLRGYFLDLAGNRVDVRLSALIMERVLGMRLEERPASAGSFAANLRSFEIVRDFITSATITTFIDVPFALLFVVVIGWIATPLIIPLLVGMAVIVIYAVIVQGRMHALTETSYRAGAMRNATLIESLVGLETVKAFGVESVMQGRWEKTAAFLARISTQLRLLASSTVNGALWAQQTVNVVVVVFGVHLIIQGEMSMGGLIAAMMLSSRAMAPLAQVAGLLTQYHHASTALQSIDEIMKREVERPTDANFVLREGFEGRIEFRDVSFNYPGIPTASLNGVSFTIKAGEKVALLGRVGSGKTTIQRLILGLYRPSSGAVLVDGVDLRQLDPAELRRHIGYVPQDVSLFYGSLRENITVAYPAADDASVVEAARVGGIFDFVNAHPEGFDMLVGERGESLSGGQRQGIAIARAVIGKPPIVLLDEPTGFMDHSSEVHIKDTLSAFCATRTMVLVTHRTAMLSLVDRIIVLDGGRVMADGAREQVVEALRQGKIGRAV